MFEKPKRDIDCEIQSFWVQPVQEYPLRKPGKVTVDARPFAKFKTGKNKVGTKII
jgi:hypothetical protein